MRVKPIAISLVGLIIPLLVYAATQTIVAIGNWGDTGIWSGGVIPSTSDDVNMNNNTDVTVLNGDDFTVTSLVTNNNNTININAGGKLTLDNLSGTALLTAGNNIVINVDGTLHISGNILINNNLVLNVTGTLIIDGDITLKNNASLDIATGGSVTVSGDFVAGNNTTVGVDGILDVSGSISVGNGSVLSGTGVVTSGSGCSGPASFCSGAPLPVEIIFFTAKTSGNTVVLTWATATEENFDYFSIERSVDGKNFKEITQIQGKGNSFTRLDYNYIDDFPLEGISYYRLKSIDFDGYTEVFDNAMVMISGYTNDFCVFPNPIIDKTFTLQTNFVSEGLIEFVIYNNLGRIEKKLAITEWRSDFTFDDLEDGIYFFKLIYAEGIIIKRVVVT